MFLGYPFGKKGWKVYDLDTGDFLVSRDVIFRENEFPYQKERDDDIQNSFDQLNVADDDWIFHPDIPDTRDRGSTHDNADDSPPLEQVDVPSPPAQVDNSSAAPSPVFVINEKDTSPAETTIILLSGDLAILPDDGSHDVTAENLTSTAKVVAVSGSPLVETLNRSQRSRQPPKKLNDYMLYNVRCIDNTLPDPALTDSSDSSFTVSGNTPYLLEHYMSDAVFSPGHQAFLAAILAGAEPKSYKEALQDKI